MHSVLPDVITILMQSQIQIYDAYDGSPNTESEQKMKLNFSI